MNEVGLVGRSRGFANYHALQDS